MTKALERHEQFEIDVLDRLKKAKFLDSLVFGGGTMLRLCHDLPRYSVDLDFWFSRDKNNQDFFKQLADFFAETYKITDQKNKHYTLLYEIKSPLSERRLKIEIRKEIISRGLEQKIVFSRYASKQVLLTGLSLAESAKRKLLAACQRTEIRDFFDLEFMLRKGVSASFSKQEKEMLAKKIAGFKKEDYSVHLGILLPKDLREYYAVHGFSYLKEQLS